MSAMLDARIAEWVAKGYRVISQSPTNAQLVRPKHFSAAEFIAMPIYLIEYIGQRELQVYLAEGVDGTITETGSGTQLSRYRKAQQLSGPMRLFWVVAAFVVFIVLVLAIQAVTAPGRI